VIRWGYSLTCIGLILVFHTVKLSIAPLFHNLASLLVSGDSTLIL